MSPLESSGKEVLKQPLTIDLNTLNRNDKVIVHAEENNSNYYRDYTFQCEDASTTDFDPDHDQRIIRITIKENPKYSKLVAMSGIKNSSTLTKGENIEIVFVPVRKSESGKYERISPENPQGVNGVFESISFDDIASVEFIEAKNHGRISGLISSVQGSLKKVLPI